MSKNLILICSYLLLIVPCQAKTIIVKGPGGDSDNTLPEAIIVDHNCVDLSAIPDNYIAGAASLRVLMRHASVGQGIDWGLNCLAGNHPTKQACSGFVAGTYDQSNWVFELRGGNWQAKIDDLVSQVASRADDFDVFMTKLCYIDALGDNHPDWEYFRSQMEQLEADYPDKKFVWWTIPLTRDGQPGTDVFNALMRSYCAANNKILFDIADIECHDPDGTKLTNAQGDEVISQNYTKEIHAGHLNIPGRIRVASAFWHLMARLAGWQKVYNTIQAAIDDANDSDVVIVNPGTYTGPGNHDIDFLGKAITVRSIDPDDPNIVAATVIDCNGTQEEPHRGFCFHSAEDPNSVVGGLTIINGYATDEPVSPQIPASRKIGGAILCKGSSPMIGNCVISGNSAAWGEGGGIFCKRSSPTITNCIFTGNVAFNGGGLCCEQSSPTLTDCVFSENVASSELGSGGGMGTWLGSSTLTNCTFSGNSAEFGGGIRNSGSATFVNCTFSRNSANKGGGMYNYRCSPTLTNCTLTRNTAEFGGGIYNRPEAEVSWRSSPVLTNCILWDNSDSTGSGESAQICHGTPVVTYSSIQGWIGAPGGTGNTGNDPCFADADNGDYHLKSQAGRWDPNRQSWFKDDVTSPCIDAGNPMSPIGYEPFPNGGIINMGAYGGTVEASRSYFGEPVCETIVAGDINGDCKVDFDDFRIMALHWLEDNRQEAGLPQ